MSRAGSFSPSTPLPHVEPEATATTFGLSGSTFTARIT